MVDLIETSPATKVYNCIAWAAEDNSQWWEPDPFYIYYWPDNVPRSYTLSAFIHVYGTLGYVVCINEILEDGFKKIAIYADAQKIPQHATRQLTNDIWTSKLGREIDVEHPFVREWDIGCIGASMIDLSEYGKLEAILKKAV